jgi:membrane peptidoglycan carboxypeptidase
VPTIPHTIRIRRRRENKILHSPARFLGLAGFGFGILLTSLLILTASGLAIAYGNLAAGLPAPESLLELLEPPNGLLLEPTRFYDRTGVHEILVLDNPARTPRSYLPLDGEGPGGISGHLVQATMATADPDFWKHPGFRLRWDLLDQSPTLAQRLVADLMLWDEPAGLRRELRERLLAAQITARFGREKILEWYLNSADYGNYAFGAEAAAQAYLGKPASQLTLAESALLAAVSQAPALNPWVAPRAARERQKEVLETMIQAGSIDQEELRQALAEDVQFRLEPAGLPEIAPAFTALVLEQLSSKINPERLARGGFIVWTTLDYDLQQQSACTTAVQVARLEGRQADSLPSLEPSPCQAANLLPIQPVNEQGDPARVFANAVVLDPASGQVLAMVGQETPGLNPGLPPGHPPGTLLTPVLYLAAFTRGWGPGSLVWDIPSHLPAETADLHNPDRTFHGPVRLRMAFANDYLVPAAWLLAEIGPEQVDTMARQLGLEDFGSAGSESSGRLSASSPWQKTFERSQITLLEASRAFGIFAAGGNLVGLAAGDPENPRERTLEAVTVLQVVDNNGKTYLDCLEQAVGCQIETLPVISAPLAYLITHILSDEPARWPSLGQANHLEIGRPAAAKIGLALESQDAWTVGYTPDLVVGVWLSNDETGGRDTVAPQAAAGLWHAILRYATRDLPPNGWSAPPGISRVSVCDPSGMLPGENCPAIVEEVFLSGSEPAYEDSLFRAYQVNRETGRLATAFTPAGFIEERVYMILPPEASDWAEAAGLPAVPDEYDLITASGTGERDARIHFPGMFSIVRGQVPFTGRAAAEGFRFYRLQVGQGLNPKEWLQVGEDSKEPVGEGRLGMWDTTGLNGLYTVQLLVVAADQQVEIATVSVTVDNQAPELSIRYPEEGEQFVSPGPRQVVFRAETEDELGIDLVEFILDGRTLAALSSPPFEHPWLLQSGEHLLKVRARDTAGNTSEASIEFTVEP